MSKYQNEMNPKKQKVKKPRWGLFFFFMFLYAVAFLGGAFYGLKYLWNYLDAYEQSRPKLALNYYMENLQ